MSLSSLKMSYLHGGEVDHERLLNYLTVVRLTLLYEESPECFCTILDALEKCVMSFGGKNVFDTSIPCSRLVDFEMIMTGRNLLSPVTCCLA